MQPVLPAFQTEWGWLIAIYLFLGGMGGSMVVVGYLHQLRRNSKSLSGLGSLIGVLLVALGTLFLIGDLTKPEIFYMVFASPHLNPGSWIVRGSAILTGLIIFGLLYSAPQIKLFSWLPWSKSESALKALGLIASIFGFLTVMYTGILIGVVGAVPFWHSPGLPLLFIASGFSTGVTGMLFVNVVQGMRASGVEREAHFHWCHELSRWDAILISVELLVMFLYLYMVSIGSPEGAYSVNDILYGSLAGPFVGGVVLMGLAIPLLLEYLHITTGKKAAEIVHDHGIFKPCYVPLIAATLVIIGGLILRYVILSAGAHVVFLPW